MESAREAGTAARRNGDWSAGRRAVPPSRVGFRVSGERPAVAVGELSESGPGKAVLCTHYTSQFSLLDLTAIG